LVLCSWYVALPGPGVYLHLFSRSTPVRSPVGVCNFLKLHKLYVYAMGAKSAVSPFLVHPSPKDADLRAMEPSEVRTMDWGRGCP
jgi:hypothetical protein